MECPRCGAPSRVLESRPADDGAAVRRRRECSACGTRYTTFERVAVDRLYVRKRDDRRQSFDPGKLRGALSRAAHKRDVSAQQINRIVAAVEKEATASGGEIGAERIGEICLGGLHDLDPGAYLQFAGTLPGANADFAAVEGVETGGSSVRAPREDAESILKAGTRRGSDE